MVNVSHGTLARADGKPVCVRCGQPVQRLRKVKGGHGARGKYQSYCNACHAEYSRQRRAQQREQRELERELGRTISMGLTPEERELILEMRAQPTGRHHARLFA